METITNVNLTVNKNYCYKELWILKVVTMDDYEEASW